MTRPEEVGMSSERLARIRPAMEKHVSDDKLAGAVTLLARRGEVIHLECVGERPMLFNLEEDPHEMHDLILERPESPEVKAAVRRLRKILCEVCSPEAVDARAKADQRRLRQEMKEDGRLVEQLWERGCERDPDRLVYRKELLDMVS